MQPFSPSTGINYSPEQNSWYCFVDGQIVAEDFPSPIEARDALTRYEQLPPEPLDDIPAEDPAEDSDGAMLLNDLDALSEEPVDPLTLYHPLGPYPDQHVPKVALDRAYALFVAHYGHDEELVKRAVKARALANVASAWKVVEPGVVVVQGSRGNWYRVSTDPNAPLACTQHRTIEAAETEQTGKACPDCIHRPGVNGGQCKHIICAELIRLAQCFVGTREATITLPGRLLGLALSVALRCGTQYVSFEVRSRLLQIAGQASHQMQLICDSGEGLCALALERSSLRTLWDDLRPKLLAQGTDDPSVICVLDRSTAMLRIFGLEDELSCPGRVL